jgi:quinone-modifying oxidoreductase subunit QmoC
VETAEKISQGYGQAASAPFEDGKSVWIEPDMDFIRTLSRQGKGFFRKCFQCGTCSATCAISPDHEPFPGKEMVWAAWGMKDRLLRDPDIWLCHQCNDCSTRCPRGARPGDVLAAVRQECVAHYAFPRLLGRWVNQPRCTPLLLGIPTSLLTLALIMKHPIEIGLDLSRHTGERIIYSYSNMFPHWMLNIFFTFFSILVLIAIIVGGVRFWRAMKAAIPSSDRMTMKNKGLIPSLLPALKSVFAHENFTLCTKARPRFTSHLCVFFGFLALFAVSVWVITAGYNPLINSDFIYPFSFWNPWKMLANIGGIALIAGCILMIRDRLRNSENFGAGTYFDWSLISMLFLAAVTGFFTEVLHYLRLEPHRHIAYFIHLVFAFAVLIYLPYSKLAHLVYRGIAMVFAEHIGRKRSLALDQEVKKRGGGREEKDSVMKNSM